MHKLFPFLCLDDGCLTKTEYEGFSAAPAAIADKIFDKFDPQHNNCLTVNSVSAEYGKMDTNSKSFVVYTCINTHTSILAWRPFHAFYGAYPRCDAAKRGVPSGAILFAYINFIEK